MKTIFIIACIVLAAVSTADSKLALICHSWRLAGTKPFGKDFRPANSPTDEVLTLAGDGTYEKLLYGQLKIKGLWKFTSDSSKLVFGVTSMNGSNVQSISIDVSKATDSIIRLSADTLIDAHLAYFGPERKYSHDDWYYVRVGE
jgi:hypothetical protein